MGKTDMKKGILKRLFQVGVSIMLLCLFTLASASAETISTASLKKGYTTAELDQMLAPVALYPDALLLQVLMACTYPAEVMEASRWLDANPDLSGDAAVEAAERLEWNMSVKSLLAFPEVLFTMSSNMDWVVKLGNAFNAQQEDVIQRVQHLRRQARAAGNLKSDERMKVVRSGSDIAIEPVSEEVIYVPYYNPTIVYGSWWWPGYSPYYWGPWRGYAYYPGYYSSSFMWGRGIWFSYTRFHGRVDWRRRHVHWSPPPRHPAPSHVRPGNRPRPDANHVRPGNRPGQSGHNQARPGMRPGQSAGNHLRPGFAGAGHNRPSVTITSRPGQRPKMAGVATYRSAHNRPSHTGQPRRNMASSRPFPSHPEASTLHSRPSRVSQPVTRPAAGMHQAGSTARPSFRPAVSQPSAVSRQAGHRSFSGMSFQGGGHRGGPSR